MDLVVANEGSDTVSVLLGDGKGGFPTRSDISAGRSPTWVAIGDLNDDGKPDLAVGGVGTRINVYFGDGSGGFSRSRRGFVDAGSIPQTVAIGDFNSDGMPDLAVGNFSSDTVSIHLGNGIGGFPTGKSFPATSPWSLTIGDLNADGRADLAVADVNFDRILVFLGDGTGNLGSSTAFPAVNGPTSVAIGDLNGDGKADLAVGNAFSETVSVLLGDDTGIFGSRIDLGVGSGFSMRSVAVGDLNGDGKLDLAVTNPGGTVSVLLNTTVTTVPFAVFDAKAEIEFGPLANDDEFEVKATFTLGAASDGIDPLTEDVSFQVGTFSTTIPAGSFKFRPAEPGKKGKPGKPARWTFEGVIDGVELEAKITDLGGGSFEFKAEGESADLTGTVNPVTVTLTIGDDGGSTTVEAEFE